MKLMDNYDIIIVGAGFAGATIAAKLKNKYTILVIDERSHIGGNAYDEYINNVLVHKYGPHIFHTNNKEVFDFLSNYTDWYLYEHKVLGLIENKLVPIPFNFTSLETLLPHNAKKYEEILLKEYGQNKKVTIRELLQNNSLYDLGKYIYEHVFKYYTIKQWGTEDIDEYTASRVPIITSYDNRYFTDEYQYMPKEGYSKLFKNMLDGIDLLLDTKSEDIIKLFNNKIYYNGNEFTGKLIYTGSIDRLFDYCFGRLPYRSLDIKEEHHTSTIQNVATVNYPDKEHEYTRITEYNHFMLKSPRNSVIHYEYPKDCTIDDIPYYPISNTYCNALYDMYKIVANNYSNLILLGRLAEYQYYNMDAVIARALDLSNNL